MLYKEFQGIQLSNLGMGSLRLPKIAGESAAKVDYKKAQEIIDYAMTHGINYYDTAYTYYDGESEKFLGEALKKYPRESYYLATKYYIQANVDYKAVFEEQLARLQTDYIDFYLIHSIYDHTWEEHLSNGCIQYFMEQKRAGRIKYFGFSSHAGPEALAAFADAYNWDFAQIQLNYLDWQFSTAKREYEILSEKGIPIMVMEPVRGGRLATLTDDLAGKLKQAQPDWSIAAWALRWVKRLPNVQVILSGMSTLEQIEENVVTFADDAALTDEQAAFLEEIGREFKSAFAIPCTECRYCCSDCPQGLDIPELLRIYNNYKYVGWWTCKEFVDFPMDKRPSACIGCGVCHSHCPQGIAIPEIMDKMAVLENSKGDL